MKKIVCAALFLLLACAAQAQQIGGVPIALTPAGCAGSTAATGGTCVQRDSSANAFANNVLANATATASAGGTTILTAASSRFQALTGSSNQTYQMPDARTLTLGPWFVFNNNSSGTLTVTNAGGSTLYTAPAGGFVECGPTNIGSANGVWDCHPLPPSTVTWGSGTTGLVLNTSLATSASINAGASSATSPSFIPQRGSPTTGFSGDSTHVYGVVGGATALSCTATNCAATTFNSSTLAAPTRQVLLSGSGATYTTPAGVRQLRVLIAGGGGGGSGSGGTGVTFGSNGSDSSFNSIVAAGGKATAVNTIGGSGGTGGSGTASFRLPGLNGQSATALTVSNTNEAAFGGNGGGPGAGLADTAGGAGGSAAANSGAGGAGGGISSVAFATILTYRFGGGGGQGEQVQYIINSPAASYTYTVGAGGAGGSAGTNGAAGGSGGSGYIIVDEIY